MIVYMDDCLIFAKDDATIEALIKSLNQTYLLEDQGTVSDYLGIRITRKGMFLLFLGISRADGQQET